MFSRLKSKNIIRICFLFLAAFFVGTGAAFLHDHFFSAAVPTSSEGNWGLSFQTDGEPPVGNATFDELKKFDAFYAQDTGEKVIYLTFDAGYEMEIHRLFWKLLRNIRLRQRSSSSAHFWKAIQNLSNRSSLPVTPSATTPGITKTCHRFLQWNPFLKKSRQLKNCISRSPDRKFPDFIVHHRANTAKPT